MEIVVGKYTVKSEPKNLWIEETQINKKGKPKQVKVGGYSLTVEQLLKSFMHYKLRDSEANSIRELLADIKKMEEDIEMLIDKGVNKHE